jgi:hypothetical protein
MCKLKTWVFDESIHQDDKFAHAGNERDFWLFSCGAQSQVKGFEDGVMLDGAQSRHVEGAPHGNPAAGDVANALACTAIPIIRGHTHQGRGGFVGDLS